MTKNTTRVVTRASDGTLRIKDYPNTDPLLELHTQIGIDDCSTDLALRGMPVFRGKKKSGLTAAFLIFISQSRNEHISPSRCWEYPPGAGQGCTPRKL